MPSQLYRRAERFVGIVLERPGDADHPLIRWWHSLTTIGEQPDSVPWCASFINGCCWDCRLPRSKSAAARSWLGIGEAVSLDEARRGYVVVLARGANPAAGHVGLYSGRVGATIYLLGGNQGDAVSVAPFPASRVIGVRRVEG